MQRFLAIGIVIWLVVGAGLLAHIESIPAQLEDSVVRVGSLVLENGETVLWQSTPARLRFEIDQIHSEVAKADSLLKSLGGLKAPIHLKINFQNKKRFRIEPMRLELGVDIAQAPGQIRHALLKSWLLQRADLRFNSSVFRQNVLADALFTVAANGLSLTLPGKPLEIAYDVDPSDFYEQIGTLATTCLSAWVPMEVVQLCEQVRATSSKDSDVYALSLRRAVGETLWKSVAGLSAFERIEFLKKWITYLETPTEVPSFEIATGSIWNWRRWVNEEIDQLLPPQLFAAIGKEAELLKLRSDALKAMGLEEIETHSVDLIARFTTSEAAARFATDIFEKRIQLGMPNINSVVAGVGDEFFLLPGGAKLAKDDFKKLRARRSVWESCEIPSVQDLLSFPIETDRTLIVQLCDDETASYRSFIGYGVEGFAIDNPGTHFVQVHRPSLEFAVEKGLLPKKDFFEQVLAKTTPRVDRKLGLNEPSWDAQLSAFRVNGVVEAIEWFRGQL